jgi:hypothetical protein
MPEALSGRLLVIRRQIAECGLRDPCSSCATSGFCSGDGRRWQLATATAEQRLPFSLKIPPAWHRVCR